MKTGNCGNDLRTLGNVILVLCILGGTVSAIVMLLSDVLLALGVLAGSIAVGVVPRILLFGFAQLVDNSDRMTSMYASVHGFTEEPCETTEESDQESGQEQYTAFPQEMQLDATGKKWVCPVCCRHNSLDTEKCLCGYKAESLLV